MQVKIFRSYEIDGLQEEINDFLTNYYTNQILKIEYNAILGHYDPHNDREHYLFTVIIHYIDHEEAIYNEQQSGNVAQEIFKNGKNL